MVASVKQKKYSPIKRVIISSLPFFTFLMQKILLINLTFVFCVEKRYYHIL